VDILEPYQFDILKCCQILDRILSLVKAVERTKRAGPLDLGYDSILSRCRAPTKLKAERSDFREELGIVAERLL
jgi:hypothetical protein